MQKKLEALLKRHEKPVDTEVVKKYKNLVRISMRRLRRDGEIDHDHKQILYLQNEDMYMRLVDVNVHKDWTGAHSIGSTESGLYVDVVIAGVNGTKKESMSLPRKETDVTPRSLGRLQTKDGTSLDTLIDAILGAPESSADMYYSKLNPARDPKSA